MIRPDYPLVSYVDFAHFALPRLALLASVYLVGSIAIEKLQEGRAYEVERFVEKKTWEKCCEFETTTQARLYGKACIAHGPQSPSDFVTQLIKDDKGEYYLKCSDWTTSSLGSTKVCRKIECQKEEILVKQWGSFLENPWKCTTYGETGHHTQIHCTVKGLEDQENQEDPPIGEVNCCHSLPKEDNELATPVRTCTLI